MSQLDAKVASVLDNRPNGDTSEDDDDALLAALEEDDGGLDALREKRMQQLAEELSRAKYMKKQEYGVYTEIKEEKALMDITASEAKYAVVHFFKPDFNRCAIMDAHLESLAPKHFDTRFLRINVENAPFLVTKLKVQVLPCVIAFVDGISVDRVIGFEGLGHTPDTFTTKDLEARLLRSGALVRAKMASSKTIFKEGLTKAANQEDDEDEWE